MHPHLHGAVPRHRAGRRIRVGVVGGGGSRIVPGALAQAPKALHGDSRQWMKEGCCGACSGKLGHAVQRAIQLALYSAGQRGGVSAGAGGSPGSSAEWGRGIPCGSRPGPRGACRGHQDEDNTSQARCPSFGPAQPAIGGAAQPPNSSDYCSPRVLSADACIGIAACQNGAGNSAGAGQRGCGRSSSGVCLVLSRRGGGGRAGVGVGMIRRRGGKGLVVAQVDVHLQLLPRLELHQKTDGRVLQPGTHARQGTV